MTERHKQLAIIAGTIVLAILLILHFRKGSGAGATAGSDYQLPAVTGVNMGPAYGGGGAYIPIVIPGLDLSGPNLNMIGACCSDCNSTPDQGPRSQGPTYVFNQGNAGAQIFNYTSAFQNTGAVMLSAGF